MKIFDISVSVGNNIPVYEGDPAVDISVSHSMAKGDAANVTNVCCGAHTGTHVDAPAHFIEGGRKIWDLDLEKLMGPARVVELGADVMAVEPRHIPDLEGVERILFKTRNSDFWNNNDQGFRKDFTFITPEAARMLAESGIKLVGIDYLSVEKFGSTDFGTHIAFLEKEVVIIEGLDLRAVAPAGYELICLPWKVMSDTGDGAPARAVLREI
jgi:arylformamidase